MGELFHAKRHSRFSKEFPEKFYKMIDSEIMIKESNIVITPKKKKLEDIIINVDNIVDVFKQKRDNISFYKVILKNDETCYIAFYSDWGSIELKELNENFSAVLRDLGFKIQYLEEMEKFNVKKHGKYRKEESEIKSAYTFCGGGALDAIITITDELLSIIPKKKDQDSMIIPLKQIRKLKKIRWREGIGSKIVKGLAMGTKGWSDGSFWINIIEMDGTEHFITVCSKWSMFDINLLEDMYEYLSEHLAPTHANGIFCPQCGEKISANSNFCMKCGNKI